MKYLIVCLVAATLLIAACQDDDKKSDSDPQPVVEIPLT